MAVTRGKEKYPPKIQLMTEIIELVNEKFKTALHHEIDNFPGNVQAGIHTFDCALIITSEKPELDFIQNLKIPADGAFVRRRSDLGNVIRNYELGELWYVNKRTKICKKLTEDRDLISQFDETTGYHALEAQLREEAKVDLNLKQHDQKRIKSGIFKHLTANELLGLPKIIKQENKFTVDPAKPDSVGVIYGNMYDKFCRYLLLNKLIQFPKAELITHLLAFCEDFYTKHYIHLNLHEYNVSDSDNDLSDDEDNKKPTLKTHPFVSEILPHVIANSAKAKIRAELAKFEETNRMKALLAKSEVVVNATTAPMGMDFKLAASGPSRVSSSSTLTVDSMGSNRAAPAPSNSNVHALKLLKDEKAKAYAAQKKPMQAAAASAPVGMGAAIVENHFIQAKVSEKPKETVKLSVPKPLSFLEKLAKAKESVVTVVSSGIQNLAKRT